VMTRNTSKRGPYEAIMQQTVRKRPPGVSEDLLASSGANRRDDLTAERAQ
jgi:hypothetical protein